MSFLLGVIVGLIVASIFVWNLWTASGTLRVDHSNPEKDLYRFEIDDLDKLDKKKKIILKIDHHANLSQQ